MRRRAASIPAMLLVAAIAAAGCGNTTMFHTTPRGAKVYLNGEPCGESPCAYYTRYGFPDRVRVQILHPGYQPAEFFLDTEPPLASYLLFGFGSYFFHTFDEEYRFDLQPLLALPAPPPPAMPLPAPPPPPPDPAKPQDSRPPLN
jgi:PEGA domain